MKKLLVIAMVGMMLTGVGCKQKEEATKNIEKNTKQIEEFQEEEEDYEEYEDEEDLEIYTDEERYAKAEEFIENAIEENNDYESCEFTVAREQNCICIRMNADLGEYSEVLSQAYDVYGYTKQEVYELLGFDVVIESLDIMASATQTEIRSQFGNDIDIVVNTYFGDDRIYCVDGDGEVIYNYFDEQ